MPRYFFHTENGHHVTDDEGTELADLTAAKRMAQALMGEILRELPNLWEEGSFRITVKDAAGLSLFMLDTTVTIAPAASRRTTRA